MTGLTMVTVDTRQLWVVKQMLSAMEPPEDGRFPGAQLSRFECGCT